MMLYPVGGSVVRSLTLVHLLVISLSLPVFGGEKLLLGFEKDECWKLAGHKKEKGERLEIRYNTYGTYHYMKKGDVTEGEWALYKTYKGKFDPLAKGVTESALVAVKRAGRLFNGFGWMRGRKLTGDWSKFDKLLIDLKSTKSAALVRIRVADRLTVPIPERKYKLPAGKWCTLEFDLAEAAAAARLQRISPKPKHGLFFRCQESAIYPARVLDRKDIHGVYVNLLKSDAGTTMLLDNLRLVSAGAKAESKHAVLTDKSPWPKPEILPLETTPSPPARPKPARKPAGITLGKPTVIDMSGMRATCYGRMHNDRTGIAVIDSGRMAINIANGGNRAVLVTADGGKTWKGLNGSEKVTNLFGGRLMMVGACSTPAADGSELLFITAIHCSGGEATSWIWFRRVAWDGKTWKADPVRIADVDSWHCPEHTMDLLRLPNGRIWGAWSPLSRTGGVIARYSDDDGKTWRALPGQLGREGHGQKRPLLLPYGKGVACFFKRGWQDYFSWSYTDGRKWSKVTHVMPKLRARPICGAAPGSDELFVACSLRKKRALLHCKAGKWSKDESAPFVPTRMSVAGKKLIGLAIKGGKVVMTVRDESGKWSPAKELAAAEKGTVDLVVPRVAPQGFLPVVWSTKAGRSINFLRVPLE
jgi:hypothetical protein